MIDLDYIKFCIYETMANIIYPSLWIVVINGQQTQVLIL